MCAGSEIRQSKNLANAAQAAGVKHFVCSSVKDAERNSGLTHFESKWQIERHMQALGIPASPVTFMDNFNWFRMQVLNGMLPTMELCPEASLQRIAVNDIGAFAALAFEKPSEFVGQAIELAGD